MTFGAPWGPRAARGSGKLTPGHDPPLPAHDAPVALRVPAGPGLDPPVRLRRPGVGRRVPRAPDARLAAVRPGLLPPRLQDLSTVFVAPGPGRGLPPGPQPAAG